MSPPSYDGPPPATGAWQEGDHPGRRRFVDTGPQDLERGGHLPAVRVAYETWGEPRVVDGAVVNAVLVLHALTGDSHVSGPAEDGHPTAGWWEGLVGPGRALDPAQWFVVAPNVLGGCQGTTGPAARAQDGRPYGSRWPGLTVRDQVETERRLADALGVRQWGLVVGGSMGGYRALEWAVGTPERVGALALVATTAAASADQIGVQSTQLLAIAGDPAWRGGDYHLAAPGDGPHGGLGLARRIAHLTYRTGAELETRFGNDAQPGEDPRTDGRYAVQSYLDHHAGKLARRFDAGSYVALTDAMNHHDVGRGRGGVEAALQRVTARTVVVGIDSDRLYPVEQQARLAAGIATAEPLVVVPSLYGHDAFLLAIDDVAAAISPLLSAPRLAQVR